MQSFKQYTAKQLLELLKKEPKLIQGEAMMQVKIDYIHQNPVKRGYVDEAIHWRYSSARDYSGISGLIEIERVW